MTRFLACALLIAAASPTGAQNIEIRCPAMPVLKHQVGLWQAQRAISVAVVTLPGEVLTFKTFTIEATFVRGILCRAVDGCVATGLSEDGSVMTLQLPCEPVKLVCGVVVVSPDCPTSRVGPGQRLAAPVVAVGTVTLP